MKRKVQGAFNHMLFTWVALYGLIHTIVQYTADLFSDWFPGILLSVYDWLLVAWIFRTGRQSAAGLNIVSFENWRNLIPLLPLAIFPLYNIVSMDGHILETPLVLQMLCVVFTEEIFFRGFLCTHLCRLGTLMGILLTSLAFSLMHAINFLSNGDEAYVWLQLICSFPISICYCAVTIRTCSILPAVGAHFLTNITGSDSLGKEHSLLGLWGCIVIYALWGTMLCLDIQRRKGDRL